MPTYGTVAGVESRTGRTFDPKDRAAAGRWLDEAEAELLGAIQQGGGPATFVADSRGALQIRAKVELYVSGLARVRAAAVSGDGGNDDGQVLLDAWEKYLDRLRTNAGNILAGFDSQGVQPDASIRMSSHATDSTLGLTDSDVRPVFTIEGGRTGGLF